MLDPSQIPTQNVPVSISLSTAWHGAVAHLTVRTQKTFKWEFLSHFKTLNSQDKQVLLPNDMVNRPKKPLNVKKRLLKHPVPRCLVGMRGKMNTS